eukprot:TRINITY_DN9180_c0_g1_i1.p1 TRINITY_DN9180_c0_g1~~TRINITY_DN9180_c0_g1_i1.p1  ORF type:complete len:1028 (-),score=164.16 TRINITY_DN9180_c0_g1_i1:253-3336(-)
MACSHQLETITVLAPSWCDDCGAFLWGVSDQGQICSDCGITLCPECGRRGGGGPCIARLDQTAEQDKLFDNEVQQDEQKQDEQLQYQQQEEPPHELAVEQPPWKDTGDLGVALLPPTVVVTNTPRRRMGCFRRFRSNFSSSSKLFWGRVRLALLVSVFVTVFSSPIFVPKLDIVLYGEPNVCNVDEILWKGPQLAEGTAEDTRVWCGYMPRSYKTYWPNVVQLIVFTVYQTTGQTVKLAWQGVSGTFIACLNIFFMCWLYPCGASDPSHRADCDPHGPLGHGYREWVAWVDLIAVVFLFLISNAMENSMKFGLSWHLFFMMNYMNPNIGPNYGHMQTGIKYLAWDSEMCVVMLTSVVGAAIAIIATVVPYPLLNLTRIDDDAVAVHKSMDRIWTEAISYFCGSQYQVRHFQIEANISSLSGTISKIKANLDSTWWETFDIACFGSRRILYLALSDLFNTLDSVMYAVKASIHSETFQGNHNRFCSMMKPHMVALKTEASTLLFLCAGAASDGRISKSEMKGLRSQQEAVKRCQASLLQAFDSIVAIASSDSECISMDMADEYAFVFALSAWARCIEDFSAVVDKVVERRCCLCGMFSWILRTIWEFVRGLFSIFTISCITHKERRSFAIRNTLTITLCFLIGFKVDVSVFTRYQATMASTVALLISHTSGSVFQQNLQRLLGLSLGKVLPLFVMVAVAQTACGTVTHSVAHGSGIFLYMFAFTYMYYSSLQWSYVGVVIAGFGCYGLLVPCNDDPRSTFGSRYEEIGQVTFAIIMQLLVDALFCLPSPRDLAIRKIMLLNGTFTKAYEAFFKADLQKMEKHERDIDIGYRDALALSLEVDPKLNVVPGKRTAFRNKLYIDVLFLMKLVRGDFHLLVMSLTNWSQALVPRSGSDVKNDAKRTQKFAPFLQSLTSLEAVIESRDMVMEHLYGSLTGFQKILAHDREEPIMDDDVYAIHRFGANHNTIDYRKIVDQINASRGDFVGNDSSVRCQLTDRRSVRIAVSLRALGRSAEHLGKIDALLLQQDIF